MPKIGAWTPIQDTHAIQSATIAVMMNESIGDITFRRAEALAGPIVSTLGFNEATPVTPNLPPQILALGLPGMSTPTGMAHVRREGDDIGERFQMHRESLRLDDFAYVRWAPFKDKARQLLGPLIELYSGASSVNSVVNEYIDVFTSDEDLKGADISDLINPNSRYIAAAAFKTHDSWHCHSGWFIHGHPSARRLVNVNVDCADSDINGVRRSVQITTRVVDQFGQPGYQEQLDAISWSNVEGLLDSSHLLMKELLREILTAKAADAISLT